MLWVLMGPQSIFNWNLSISILLYSLDEQTYLLLNTYWPVFNTQIWIVLFFPFWSQLLETAFSKGKWKATNTQS